MREILFRGKRVPTGEWVYGFYAACKPRLSDSNRWVIQPVDERGCPEVTANVDPNTVGQYTGLTDNVRQRIFEGDIVSILPDDGEMGVIKWSDDEAMFVLEADGWCANFDNYYSTDLEVIGNIHDNPELLKGE